MTTVGLIGLGNMGIPMAKNLIDAGYGVLGFRRSDASDFEEIGGKLAASPRAVAEEAEIVLCCIPGDDALQDVVSGPQGIATGDCTGTVLAELSTLSSEVKSEQAAALAAKGGIMLDGAISGLPPMVAARTAVFMLSGDEAAYAKTKPVLEALTEKLFFMGPFGAAFKAKLCANMLVAANIAATAETLAFGAMMGLDQVKLIEALRDGAGGSVQFSARAERMAKGDWHKVLASTALLAKDIRLIEKMGGSLGSPMPVLTSVDPFYEQAIEEGYGQLDVAAVYAAFATAAGLPVPGK
ncbi:NAD(P)-dependent oxidoreductase [Amorphus sp. 3PC139-8]|uniref:NAD(P)-dependent oxidoreductase n=1 Tax=Amorphus sp. 3PC139-8 TaxID=2735676 RepID=UPI00345D24D0